MTFVHYIVIKTCFQKRTLSWKNNKENEARKLCLVDNKEKFSMNFILLVNHKFKTGITLKEHYM